MSTDLAPKPEPTLPADAWARAGKVMNDDHFNTKGRISQAEIDEALAAYLAAGGEIQVIPMGKTGEASSEFNNRTVAVSSGSKFSLTERTEHAQALKTRIYAADASHVAMLKEHLPLATAAKDLCHVLGCSADKLDRLLRTYFSGDETAKPFMRLTREARTQHIVDQYPLIAGRMGLRQAASRLHVSMHELKRVIALHNLKPAATSAQVWNNPGRHATREAAEDAA